MGKQFEIIAVDDGSNDGSAALIRQAAAEPPLSEGDLLSAQHRAVGGVRRRLPRGHAARWSSRWTPTGRTIRTTSRASSPSWTRGSTWSPAGARIARTGWSCGGSRRCVANVLIRKVTGTQIHDLGCSLKVYRKELTDEIRLYGEMHRFISVLADGLGARVGEVVVNHRPRVAGRSKYGLLRTIKVMLDITTIWFMRRYQTKPIYVFGGLGALMLLVGLGADSALRPVREDRRRRLGAPQPALPDRRDQRAHGRAVDRHRHPGRADRAHPLRIADARPAYAIASRVGFPQTERQERQAEPGMCGIAGFIAREADPAALPRMLRQIAHRGPDGEGIWRGGAGGAGAWRVALGHRRLAIIDLAGGAQPMGNEDGAGRHHLQRRGLQLSRAARGAGAAGAPLSHPQRHRDDRPPLRAARRRRHRRARAGCSPSRSGTRAPSGCCWRAIAAASSRSTTPSCRRRAGLRLRADGAAGARRRRSARSAPRGWPPTSSPTTSTRRTRSSAR